MTKCPECELTSGIYQGFKGVWCCDNCGWFEGKDLEECDDCGHRADREQLHECANSIPVHRGPWHCDDCLPDCGSCRDEMARDWQDEHGPRSRG